MTRFTAITALARSSARLVWQMAHQARRSLLLGLSYAASSRTSRLRLLLAMA